MALTKQQFAAYIKSYEFRDLFNDLGWNNDRTKQPIVVDGKTYMLNGVAEKSGFKILICDPGGDGLVPDSNIRKKIETKVTKLFQEHLIIFTDAKRHEQIWQLVIRQTGKPLKLTETRYYTHQDVEIIYQKASGLFFEISEEEDITIVDVTKRVAENFYKNAEKVTGQFYTRFKKEHSLFYDFVKGIDDQIDAWNKRKKKTEPEKENKSKQWYVSLMLNRLMFCYFIQKKGFLDKNQNYLRDKLKECKHRKGKDKFYSFYRDFLLVLFHEGLNEPERKKKIQEEIGIVPYLNGGLFDVHELERTYKEIDIDDKAFEHIFDFFDEYEWHLDTRKQATGKEINPDVIGYIFEKYINERWKMGAYYTKEDITDYISKNCIIPWLFDETARNYSKAFAANGEIWAALKESGDTYIYSAVKQGIGIDLPKNIAAGIKDVAKRTDWNKPATSDLGLPTEIWREVVERRNRYDEVLNKIKSGSITNINDFITYNLNIREFAQDVIANTSDPEFLKAFFKTLCRVTIIDPTCGSGAFLFAAMNILEPLYYACITRMRGFTTDEDRENEQSKKFSNKYKSFRVVLENIHNEYHPSDEYYIYKTIILKNLYGVDIMREAVEIAKLRLFLKLVAIVDADYRKDNLGLEPLPDIDFNIRPGNTLIGFGTESELDKALTYTLEGQEAKPAITEKMEVVSMAYNNFKDNQVVVGNYRTIKKNKQELYRRLKSLNDECNQLLHKRYSGIPFDKWLLEYQPFHWFAEFFEILHSNGGFDIVIGNPPYLEQRQINYEPKYLRTFSTNAVHNMCIERSLQILTKNGNIAMIVPLALVCTQRMQIVQNLLEESRSVWYSNYAWRPGRLFDSVNRALCIFIANHNKGKAVYTGEYRKWLSEVRDTVFQLINYQEYSDKRSSFWVPKLRVALEKSILQKVLDSDSSFAKILSSNSLFKVYYRTTGGLYWKVFTNFPPKFYIKGKEGKSSRETFFTTKAKNYDVISVAILSSDIFWWWYTVTSNLRDLNPADIQGFHFPSSLLDDEEILNLGKKYLKDIQKKSVMLTRIQKQTGETQTQSFKISQSKEIIDQIDDAIAEHYGFTEEEIDFIKSYDFKFRMSTVEEEEE